MQPRPNRSKRSVVARLSTLSRAVETLEPRQLLASSVATSIYDVSKTPVFTPSTDSLKDAKAGPLAKGGSALVKIADEYRRFVRSGGKPVQFDSQYDDRYVIKGNMLGVTLRTRGSFNALVQTVRDAGGSLIARNRESNVVKAWLPIGQVRDIASRQEIMHVRPLAAPTYNVGLYENETDVVQRAADLRAALGVDGTGVKIGVLSNSVDQLFGGLAASEASGDLPAGVTVLQDLPEYPFDEGRAMLELIHDVAPGAELYYHTTGITEESMATGINALLDAGVDILVDDFGLNTSPFFQAGIIGDAISGAINKGVPYFGSMGNQGVAGYQSTANWTTDATGTTLNDFDPATDRVDTKLTVTFSESTLLTFQWDNPYNGTTGAVTADIDFYVSEPGFGIIAAGEDDNFATGVPIEQISVPAGTYEIEIVSARVAEGATAPSVLRFSATSPAFDGNTAEYKPNLGTPTAPGYRMINDQVVVGAIDYRNTIEYGAVNDQLEDFSSAGPGRLLFKENGTPRKPFVVQKPDIVAVNGTNTSVVGFAPFYGTSAAAPNAAAIGVLMLQANPSLTPAEMRQALIDSSRPFAGQTAGTWDNRKGYGIADAARAVAAVATSAAETPTYASIDRPEQNPKTNGINALTIRFSAPVTGVDRGDFDLLLNDLEADDLLTRKVTVEQIDAQTYRLNGLRPRTQSLGLYYVALKGEGITDANGNPVVGLRTNFRNELRPPTDLKAETVADGSIRLRWTDINPAETGWRIIRSTDPKFRGAKQTFNLPADATSYLDTTPLPSTTYYYRVQAVRDGQFGNIAYTSANSLSAGETIVDVGASALPDFASVNVAFLDDERAYGGSAVSTSVVLLPDGSRPAEGFVDTDAVDLSRGEYFVYARWINNGNNASNVKYKVRQVNADGSTSEVASYTVNQSAKRAGGWVVLGKVKLDPKKSTFVRTDVKDATNETVIDAFRFLPANTSGLDEFGDPVGASLGGSPVAGRLVVGGVATSNFGAQRITDGVLRVGPRGVIFE